MERRGDEWAEEWRMTGVALFHCVFFKDMAVFDDYSNPTRSSQPERGALSPLRSHSLIKTQSQATNSNKPSTSSLKKGWRRVVVKMQITVGPSARPSVRDLWNRNAVSNHFWCKKSI